MIMCGKNGIKCYLITYTLFLLIFAAFVKRTASMSPSYGFNSYALATSAFLVVNGILVAIIALLGCVGAFRESKMILGMFTCVLLVIFIGKLILITGLAVIMNIFDLKEMLLNTLSKYPSDDDLGRFWDDLQKNGKCCGVNNYKDWKTIMRRIPLSCCVLPESKIDVKGQFCHSLTPIHSEGCYTHAKVMLKHASQNLILAGAVFCFIELTGVILACMLMNLIQKENKSERFS